MTIYKELSFENEVKNVEGIQFSIMSADDIRKMSVAEIVSTDTYSGNEPIIGGLFDSRMGVIENDKTCKVCMQKNTFCPGHFGHIELSKPVFHMQFFDVVRKILKCVCFRCSTLLVDPNDPEIAKSLNKKISRQKKFDLIYKACSKVKRCGTSNPNGCGAKQPNKITKENIGRIVMEWKEDGGGQIAASNGDANSDVKKVIFIAEDVLNIFKRITDEDALQFGFSCEINRPEALICTVFPVPPPAVRPSVRNDTGQRCEDDLTHKLCDIIKTNNTLRSKIEKDDRDTGETSMAVKEHIDYWISLVQYHISTFVDNQLPGVPPAKQRTGRPLRSVTERLKSKEGRIRGNLMGKRVDFSARSVITPDPNISIDEVGVPIKIAMNLTFPEIVNNFNKKKLIAMISNGPDNYPGAKYIKKNDSKYRTIRLNANNVKDITEDLKNGDIVERHLCNGDYVLFNRQPSLHKMSMMAHKVRVMEYDTFRLNVCCTPSYNADYDGDEMNMHVPQSLQTENELIELASVPTQIISPKDSAPIISVVQDIALGIYKMTHDDVNLLEKQVFNLLANNTRFTGKVPEPNDSPASDLNLWSGQKILSSVFPPTLNTEVGNVVIENGSIKKGILSKKTYQEMTNGVVHAVYNDLGKDETCSLFDNTQRLVCDWLVYHGFSVGVSDLIIDKKTKEQINVSLEKIETDVEDFFNVIHNGGIENNSMLTNEQYVEKQLSAIISSGNKHVECSVINDENIKSNDNRLLNMINSKSKGNLINVIQMMGTVGQCSVDGKRINYGFDNRTLPHYCKYDDGPEARGFVKHSFIDGLTPQEFFFHAMGGREGLIDTAVKTSETGYIQRKLVKAMEDCKVNFDLSVRNANGQIIQFIYGDDGMHSCKLEKQQLCYLSHKMSIDKIRDDFFAEGVKSFKGHVTKQIFDEMMENESRINASLIKYFNDILEDRKFVIEKILKFKSEDSIIYPVAFDRLIKNTVCVYSLQNYATASDLSVEYIFEKMTQMNSLEVSKSSKCNGILVLLIRNFLNPKNLIQKLHFTKDAFDYLCTNIELQFFKAIVHPSELVGVVAAQSIGEPTTQLTLNTFHLSGVASASKAVRGVPRIKELLSVSKNIKSPSLTIHLTDEYNSDLKQTEIAKTFIQTTYLSDFIDSIEIAYEKNIMAASPEDQQMEENQKKYSIIPPDYYRTADLECGPNPWVLRIEINKIHMITRNITCHDIYKALTISYNNKMKCIHSDDSSDTITFRIQLIDDKTQSSDIITDMKAIEQELMGFVINGMSGIKHISIDPTHDVMHINPETLELESQIYLQTKKSKDECHPDYVKPKEVAAVHCILVTDGTNLLDVLGLSKYVDPVKTISNDIFEIYEVLGIEAARQALFNEIDDIFKESGNVNQRHIGLLVDTMTSKGSLLSIDRHGINRSDIGPLAKCSFEETADVLIKSGVFGDFDIMQGVAANVIVGQIPKSGTGDSDILLDESIITKANKTIPDEDDSDDDEDDITHIDCSKLQSGFSIPSIAERIEDDYKTDLVINQIAQHETCATTPTKITQAKK